MILVNTTTIIQQLIDVYSRTSVEDRNLLGNGRDENGDNWCIWGALPNDWSPIPDNWRF